MEIGNYRIHGEQTAILRESDGLDRDLDELKNYSKVHGDF